jgi:hypothetical protein
MQVGDTVTRNELAPSIDQRQLWGSQIMVALESGEGNIRMEWLYERQHLQAIAKMLCVTLNDEIAK